LDAHRVVRGTVEGFDPQMLLDPFEKQFDPPPAAVELRDGQRRLGEVVGEKNQRLAGLRIAKADSPQGFRKIAPGVEAGQDHRLVETQTRGLVHQARVASAKSKVLFGPRDEEGRAERQAMQSSKVQIAAVDDVERTG